MNACYTQTMDSLRLSIVCDSGAFIRIIRRKFAISYCLSMIFFADSPAISNINYHHFYLVCTFVSWFASLLDKDSKSVNIFQRFFL